MEEELKANSLCPRNLAAIDIPAWEELEGAPGICNDQADARTRAGIGVSKELLEFSSGWE